MIKENKIQLGIENNLISQFTSFVGIDRITGDTFGDKLMKTMENSRMRHTSTSSSGYQGNKKEDESKQVEQLSQSEKHYRRIRDLNIVASQRCRLRRKKKFSQCRTSRVQRFSRPHSSSGKTKTKIQYLRS